MTEQKCVMKPVELVFQNLAGAMERHSLPWFENMTVEDLLEQSQCFAHHPYLQGRALGIFSVRAELKTMLSPGDRVEIYAPLKCDPKEARRLRVKKK